MEVSDTLLRSMKARRMTDAQIAAATGIAEPAVRERVRQLYAEQNRSFLSAALADPNEYEIMLRASAIRLTWSPAEEERRRGGNCQWMPPDVSESAVSVLAGTPNQLCWRSRLR